MPQNKTVSDEAKLSRTKTSIGFAKVVYYFCFSIIIPVILALISPFFIPFSLLVLAGSIWYGRKIYIPRYASKRGVKYVE